jgi:hypothetical protein
MNFFELTLTKEATDANWFSAIPANTLHQTAIYHMRRRFRH